MTEQVFQEESKQILDSDCTELTKNMQSSISCFFKEHQVFELFPDNAKILILSYDSSIQQCINAMVIEQNVQSCVCWDSEKKEFLGMIAIRDLLEIIVYICQILKEAYVREDLSNITEKTFIQIFKENYIMMNPGLQANNHLVNRRSLRRVDSGLHLRADMSMLPKILSQITLHEWFLIVPDVVKFNKSQLIVFNIEDPIHDLVTLMSEKGLNHVAIMNQDQTQIQGFVTYNDIIRYLVDNYNGDLSFFDKPIIQFTINHVNVFPQIPKLVYAKETETVFNVLKKMCDNRVSCIPIERQIKPSEEFTTRTIGLAYLTDLMFMFRVPGYYKYLDEPILNFITDLNALEEDTMFTSENQSHSMSNLGNNNSNDVGGITQPLEELKAQSLSSLDEPYNTVARAGRRRKTITIDEELDSEDSEDYEDDEDYKQEKLHLAEMAQQFKKQNQQMQEEQKKLENKTDTQKLSQLQDVDIEDLFGKVLGIERVLLMKKNDTLKDVIEKISLIPESKLIYVDVEQEYPKIKNILSLTDLFKYLASQQKF
eukprot:403375069